VSDSVDHLRSRLGDLRAGFDRSFARVQNAVADEHEDFLAIGVGNDSYAVRVRELAGLHAARAVTRLPSPLPDLLGIAGFRGVLVAVYDLAATLGYERAESARWLILASDAPVSFVFARFEGHLRVAADAVSAEGGGARNGAVREVLRSGSLALPVLHLPTIVAASRERASRLAPKEDG
jgi:purine-binding chemotaxis protein CheW